MARSVDLEEDENLAKRAAEAKSKDEMAKKRLMDLNDEFESLCKENEKLIEEKMKKKGHKKASKLAQLRDQYEMLQSSFDDRLRSKELKQVKSPKPTIEPSVDKKYEEELKEKLNTISDENADLEFKLKNLEEENDLAWGNDENERLTEEIKSLEEKTKEYNLELKRLQVDTNEIKENIESEMEKQALLSAELCGLKANDFESQDGKSLFSEVEDERQKNLSELKHISNRYEFLKAKLAQKHNELSKLEVEKINLHAKQNQDSILKKINEAFEDACYSRVEEIKDIVFLEERHLSGVVHAEKWDQKRIQSWLDIYKEDSHHFQNLKRDFESRLGLLNSQTEKLSSEIEELKIIQIELMNRKENLENGQKEPQNEVEEKSDLMNQTERRMVSFAHGTKH